MNTTQQMMNDTYPPMVNRTPICVWQGETSFHSLCAEGLSGTRRTVFAAFSHRFGGVDVLAPCLRAVIECFAMAGVVFFAMFFTLLLGA